MNKEWNTRIRAEVDLIIDYLQAASSFHSTFGLKVVNHNALMLSVVVVHGGAGAYSTAAQANLPNHRKAVEAVQAAVEYLEDDPTFNAGRGSYLTSDFQIEMDATIMDGIKATVQALLVSAVGFLTNVKNPIKAARLVMDKSDHTLFVSDGALKFAESHGIKRVPLEELITKKSVDKLKANPVWNPSLHAQIYDQSSSVLEHDTVGAVAVDVEGNMNGRNHGDNVREDAQPQLVPFGYFVQLRRWSWLFSSELWTVDFNRKKP
ncbi:hypothetical protein CAPTEDRAFT_200928 [Capitella teleta]|uniref:Uncharacterized protein n=1 Tax=Capitella teleta TaxID=283909 RepID=R7TWU7_CAPTE|nr:hypothetical protein CAPTEDRAFT_200928 [Capitella teleta]|eukprot:ELT98082.1 hypothetical protein CAPTEDRAFT_200928 [Capitella teleta]